MAVTGPGRPQLCSVQAWPKIETNEQCHAQLTTGKLDNSELVTAVNFIFLFDHRGPREGGQQATVIWQIADLSQQILQIPWRSGPPSQ